MTPTDQAAILANVPGREELAELLAEFDDETRFLGVMLFGSGARAALTRYSDLDLAFFTREPPATAEEKYQLCYRRGRLISRSIVSLEASMQALTQAEEAIFAVGGLRDARILRDNDAGVLADLQAQAQAFTWTTALRREAHRAASYHLMGNVEELQKLLRGLAEADDAALLNGAWGIALAAPKMMALYHGALSRGDNLFPAQVCEVVGPGSGWSQYYAIATGRTAGPVSHSPLVWQAIGAAWLYAETARLLDEILLPEHRAVVETALRIAQESGFIPTDGHPRSVEIS